MQQVTEERQQEREQIRVKMIAAMHLYEQIKDYSSWQKSKLLRIKTKQYNNVKLNEVNPQLQIIFGYGQINPNHDATQPSKSIHNVVLQEIATSQPQQNSLSLPPLIPSVRPIKNKLSFVTFKRRSQHRNQILKLVSKQPDQHFLQRIIVKKKAHIPHQFPKQLQLLKDKMLNLQPIAPKRRLSEGCKNASQVYSQQASMNRRRHTQNDEVSVARSRFLGSMQSILHRSRQRSQDRSIVWQVADAKRVERTEDDFLEFMKAPNACPDAVREFNEVIKQQERRLDEEMCRESMEEEKNSVWERYDQKIKLEKDSYRKNVQALIQFRKAYRVEKQKEQIKANGIKRMKNILSQGKTNKKNNKMNPQRK